MAELLKNVTLKRNGTHETVKAEDALKGKVVALYFSAHWCPPCRAFTPILKSFYETLAKEAAGDLEIVFIPYDRSDADVNKYLEESHGNWLYIPYGDENIRKLAEQFSVSGIPSLTVVKQDGSLITSEGRAEVQASTPKEVILKWKSGL